MNIDSLVTTTFEAYDVDTPISKVAGAFDDPARSAVVVTDADGYFGIITRVDLATSHHHPSERAGSRVRFVPAVPSDADVRAVARLMIGAEVKLLPVIDEDEFVGVITADDILEAVGQQLNVVDVSDVYTANPVTVGPETTIGEALHLLRENRITHVPVVEDAGLAGIVSIHDVIGFTTRDVRRPRGGNPSGGGDGGGPVGLQARGGYGERAPQQRLLDILVRDVMTAPVMTVAPDAPLDTVVQDFSEREGSSLVVVDGDRVVGIVTKTDVLNALTLEVPARDAVQVFGADLLDDMTYDEVVERIDRVLEKYGDMTCIEAKVHLHEHDERFRGTPLLFVRVRLFTDRGMFIATGEGFGASPAMNAACTALERELSKGKTYGRSKKHPDDEYWERIFGWYLSP